MVAGAAEIVPRLAWVMPVYGLKLVLLTVDMPVKLGAFAEKNMHARYCRPPVSRGTSTVDSAVAPNHPAAAGTAVEAVAATLVYEPPGTIR